MKSASVRGTIWIGCYAGLNSIGCLSGDTKCKEEEECSTSKLADEEDDFILDQQSSSKDSLVVVRILDVLWVGMHKLRQSTFEDDCLSLFCWEISKGSSSSIGT